MPDVFFGGAPDRFASQNLVGALLLHWVAGITFMLFVTVSVLQLREVLHPDLLAKIIRPQEPHPDLLGSLLQVMSTEDMQQSLLGFGRINFDASRELQTQQYTKIYMFSLT